MRVLLDPAETGAVTISLHQDVQGEAYDFPATFFARRVVARRAASAGRLGDRRGGGCAPRGASGRSLIAGGGVRYSEAEAELRGFADALGIPVAETSAGQGRR